VYLFGASKANPIEKAKPFEYRHLLQIELSASGFSQIWTVIIIKFWSIYLWFHGSFDEFNINEVVLFNTNILETLKSIIGGNFERKKYLWSDFGWVQI
jgi:hypothetical protein